jgi:hypothetical protein
MDGSKILIFSGTKRGADEITRVLRQDGWPARAIHGDKSQSERDWVCPVAFAYISVCSPPLPSHTRMHATPIRYTQGASRFQERHVTHHGCHGRRIAGAGRQGHQTGHQL